MQKLLVLLIIYCFYADGMYVSMNHLNDKMPSSENYGINETIHNEIFQAMAINDIDTFRHILERKAWMLETKDSTGSTLLHIACTRSKYSFVKFLINQGADVMARDCFYSTPLHNAAYAGSLDIVEYLIAHGALIEAVDCFNSTPLYFACQAGNLDVICYLIQHGADINYADNFGRTPIQAAFECGELSVIKHFIKNLHVNIEIKMLDGRSPLHLAALHGYTDVALYLIRKGANILSLDSEGKTPLDLATTEDIRQILGNSV